MRNRALVLGAMIVLGGIVLIGCDNTQGTSANTDMLPESVGYTNNDNPQNTGAGAGTMIKPPAPPTGMVGGETPSQATAKGTDDATGVSNEGGLTPGAH